MLEEHSNNLERKRRGNNNKYYTSGREKGNNAKKEHKKWSQNQSVKNTLKGNVIVIKYLILALKMTIKNS